MIHSKLPRGLTHPALRAAASNLRFATSFTPVSKSLRSFSSGPQEPFYKFEEMYTTNYQDLPRLPIPDLDKTLDRYIESLRPITEPEALEAHIKLVEGFRTNEGPKLQEALVKIDNHQGYPYSYVQKYWDDMYLQLRCPSSVHVNVGYSLRDDDDSNKRNAQAKRLSKFLISCFRFQKKLISGLIEPDKHPTCLAALSRVLGTARIPKQGRDQWLFCPFSHHIVFVKNGHFFRIDVQARDGSVILSQEALENQIQSLIDRKIENQDGLGIGLLTMEDRDLWAKHREVLEHHDPANKRWIDVIDSALLIVCLDSAIPQDWTARSGALLHGTDHSNRWFDKFQIISDPSGTLGVNFEHSYADGVIWNRWLSETWYDMQDIEPPSGWAPLPRIPEVPEIEGEVHHGPMALEFNIPEGFVKPMQEAKVRAQELVEDLDTHMTILNTGKNRIKSLGISPDGFVQMAIQLAYYRLHGKTAATYEACSTNKFFHGRTETIRSAHNEAHLMSKGLSVDRAPVKPGYQPLSKSQKIQLIRSAANRQQQVSKEAANGEGVDRHLMVLAKMATGVTPMSPPLTAGNPDKLPTMFKDDAYANSQTWILSTSNVTTPWNVLFNFGPVVDNGYGLGYLIHDEDIHLNVTSWNMSKETDSDQMVAVFSEACAIMEEVLQE